MKRETDADWQALYALIPKIACQRKCEAYCGPIGMTSAEYARLPQVPLIGRIGENVYLKPRGFNCPFLKGNQCRVRELRPTICRIWGVAQGALCPHGCKAERILTRDEARTILLEAELLSKSCAE